MSWMRLALTAVNGLFTTSVAISLIPVAVIYPSIAEILACEPSASPIYAIGRDGLLCFGPLLLPLAVALGLVALRSAWLHEPTALRLNGSALAAWCATALGIVLAVTA